MKQFFLILSGLALLTGCSSKNDSVEGPVQSRIRIAPSISRVTGLNFDTGDRIGLTIVKSGANYCENTPLRFDGTVFVSDDLFWYDDPSEKSNLTAYYPYLAEGAPASFTVRADQKLAADHEASDLLAATATDVVPSQTAVNMVFTHLLTKIVIDITNNSANTIEEVTLKGSRCTATVDLSAKSVQVDASSAETDIYPFPTVTAGRYEAILVPQRAALELEIQTSDGNRHTKTFQATDLQSGAEYAIEAVISNTNKIHASISGAVKGWEDGGAIAPVEDDLPKIPTCWSTQASSIASGNSATVRPGWRKTCATFPRTSAFPHPRPKKTAFGIRVRPPLPHPATRNTSNGKVCSTIWLRP